jgi:hypothetical protein
MDLQQFSTLCYPRRVLAARQYMHGLRASQAGLNRMEQNC